MTDRGFMGGAGSPPDQGGYPGGPEDGEDSPLFKTDDFRLWCMKVIPCTKRFVHDWTICPFAHAGEKAVRRDPRLHNYTGIACPDMKKTGACIRGEKCPYAHNVFEYWLHPTRYRTQLCNDGPMCRRSICFFAHSLEELRVPSCKPYVSPEALARASLEAIKNNPHPLGQQLPNPVAQAAHQQAALAAMQGRGGFRGGRPGPGSDSGLAPSAMPFVPGTVGPGGSFRASGEPTRYSAPGSVQLLAGSPLGEYGGGGGGAAGMHSIHSSELGSMQQQYAALQAQQAQQYAVQQAQQQRWAAQQGSYGAAPSRGPPPRTDSYGSNLPNSAQSRHHAPPGREGYSYPSAPARAPSPPGSNHRSFASFAAVQQPPAHGFGSAPAPQPFGSSSSIECGDPQRHSGAGGALGGALGSSGGGSGGPSSRAPSDGGDGSGRASPGQTDDLAQSLASLKIALTQQQLAAAAGSNHEVVITTLHQILKDAMAQQGSFGALGGSFNAGAGGPSADAIAAAAQLAQQALACNGYAAGPGSPNAASTSFGSAPSTISSSLAGSVPHLPLSPQVSNLGGGGASEGTAAPLGSSADAYPGTLGQAGVGSPSDKAEPAALTAGADA